MLTNFVTLYCRWLLEMAS